MNSAKKILKEQGKNNKSKDKKAVEQRSPKVAIIIGAICLLAVVAVVLIEQLAPKLIFEVGKSKVYLSDAMYDIYNQEAMGASMDQFYQNYTGKSYWDTEMDDAGNSGREVAKTNVEKTITEREVLYQEAKKKNYKITADEKKDVKKQVTDFFKDKKAKLKSKIGFSTSELTALLEKDAVAQRYKQDLIDGFDIDDQALTDSISKTDYREYDIQYYFVPLQTTDKDNKQVAVDEATKTKYKAEIDAIYEKAKTAEDFTKLISEEEAKTANVKYNTKNFIETDEAFVNEDLMKEIKAMENDDMTKVVEDTTGYYIIKMIDNNSTASYEKAVKDAISAEENKQYTAKYEEIEGEYEIDINFKNWDKVELGEMTL